MTALSSLSISNAFSIVFPLTYRVPKSCRLNIYDKFELLPAIIFTTRAKKKYQIPI